LSASKQLEVWVVDDDESVRWVLEKALRQADMQPRSFERGEHLLDAIEKETPDVLITDVRMPGMDGLALLERLSRICPALPVIVVTAHSDLENAVAAYQGGAFEYLPKPFDIDEAIELVRKADRSGTRHAGGISINWQACALEHDGPDYRRIRYRQRARCKSAASAWSAREQTLCRAEYLCYCLGAAGVDARRIGRFEQADGGTLFLDEIGDMSTALQTRLLRVLAESEFYRVGGQTSVNVDVRVIAATNQDLAQAVEEGRFREDLYHRLNVIRINTPPLRQRRQDIPMLLGHYLEDAAQELDVPAKSLNSEAMEILQGYDWPGNVRQLVNATRRMTVTAPGGVIAAIDIPEDLGGRAGKGAQQEWTQSLAYWAERELGSTNQSPLIEAALPEFEKTLIRIALDQAQGHRQQAAKLLGWGRNTLTRKIRSLNLE
jgi:two-component system nitrogen regulation response regulator GlnG